MAGKKIKGEIVSHFKSVLPNLTALTLAEIVFRSVNFISNVFIARYFAVNEFGKIGFITSIIACFNIIIDFGFDIYGIREIAKSPSTSKFVFNQINSVKLFLALITFGLVVVTSIFFSSGEEKYLYLLYGLTIISTSINFSWYFKAIEKMNIIFKAKAFSSLIFLSLILLLTVTIRSILIIPIALLVSQLTEFFIYKNDFSEKFKINFRNIFDKVKSLFAETFLIGLSSFFILVYYNLDMIMLGYYKGHSEVGIYNAAYKIFLIFIVPFQLIITAFFPRLSRNKPSKTKSFKSLFYTYSLSLFISSLILFIVLFYFPNEIIHIVFGLKYAEAYKPLSILSLNVLVIAINIIFGNPLIAWGQQKKYIIPIGIGAIINIILNIILIPKYSYNGAALATLFSEVAVSIGIIFYFSIYYSKNIKLES